MDHQNRDVVTHVHRPDRPYDQAADRRRTFTEAFASARALVLAFVTGFTLPLGGMLVAGGLGGWAGVCLAVGVGCLFTLWVRGERS